MIETRAHAAIQKAQKQAEERRRLSAIAMKISENKEPTSAWKSRRVEHNVALPCSLQRLSDSLPSCVLYTEQAASRLFRLDSVQPAPCALCWRLSR